MPGILKAIFCAFIILTTSAGHCAQDIPYIKQDITSNKKWLCGAASLAMVYRSYGKKVDQRSIFYDIAVRNKAIGSYCSTSLQCRNVLKHGFYALDVKSRQPLTLLNMFHDKWDNTRPRIIFIQKAKGDDEGLHSTVMVDVTDKDVIVHDPLSRPFRLILKDVFMYLWSGQGQNNYESIAVSDKRSSADRCRICGRPIPDFLICPNCRRKVILQPNETVGCIFNDCAGRLWNEILCPYCDKYFS